jgi:RNA polymerase sigma factor (sigma-70 family)
MSSTHAVWPTTDATRELVAHAQRGEAPAVNTLLAALRPPLVAFFARRISPDLAEDLAQVALIRITRALPTIEPDRADRFIVTVACNLLRTAYSERNRDLQRWAPAELADAMMTGVSADRLTEYEELARAVLRISNASLPPELREVVLGLLRDETPAEIAARTGIHPVTVRTRLMRARAILRKGLQSHLATAENGAEWQGNARCVASDG